MYTLPGPLSSKLLSSVLAACMGVQTQNSSNKDLKSTICGNSCSILRAQCSSQHFKEAEINFKRTMHSIIGSWNRILKKWWAVVRTVKPPKNFLNMFTLLLICCLPSFFVSWGLSWKQWKYYLGVRDLKLSCCVVCGFCLGTPALSQRPKTRLLD